MIVYALWQMMKDLHAWLSDRQVTRQTSQDQPSDAFSFEQVNCFMKIKCRLVVRSHRVRFDLRILAFALPRAFISSVLSSDCRALP